MPPNDPNDPNKDKKPRPTPLSPHIKGTGGQIERGAQERGDSPSQPTPPPQPTQITQPSTPQPPAQPPRPEAAVTQPHLHVNYPPPEQYDPNRYQQQQISPRYQESSVPSPFGDPNAPYQNYPPTPGYGGQPAQGNDVPPIPPARGWLDSMPPWFPRDPNILTLLAAGGAFTTLCVVAACVVLFIAGRPLPAPATPTPAVFVTPTDIVLIVTSTPDALVPTTSVSDPSVIGTVLNPYANAQLENMNGLALDVLDPLSGSYQRTVTLVANTPELLKFVEVLNIANFIIARDTACPDHVRLSISRPDGSLAILGLCLKQEGVILRGDVPGLRGNDLLMGPLFIDVLKPYLPTVLRGLLP